MVITYHNVRHVRDTWVEVILNMDGGQPCARHPLSDLLPEFKLKFIHGTMYSAMHWLTWATTTDGTLLIMSWIFKLS